MNIALFATSEMAYKVAKFFSDMHERLACLVLDAKASNDLNSRITQVSALAPHEIFYNNDLRKG